MTSTASRKTLLYFTLLITSSLSGQAAELRLKSEAICRGPLVRLGDLVEVDANPSDEIRRFLNIEMFAAPAAGQRRVVRAREVRELLALHDVNANTLKIAGADVVEVMPAGGKLPTTQASLELVTAKNKLMVVVPVRSIMRGDMVRQGDVELKQINRITKGFAYATRIEDVLGREASRQMEPSQPIDLHWLQQPLLVRRNETITVVSRAAGVQVRTSAKALEDGSKGDNIMVEELDGKKRQRFSARVSGLQEAEIFAGVTNVVSNNQNSAK